MKIDLIILVYLFGFFVKLERVEDMMEGVKENPQASFLVAS
jgi:hypothetical protein